MCGHLHTYLLPRGRCVGNALLVEEEPYFDGSGFLSVICSVSGDEDSTHHTTRNRIHAPLPTLSEPSLIEQMIFTSLLTFILQVCAIAEFCCRVADAGCEF